MAREYHCVSAANCPLVTVVGTNGVAAQLARMQRHAKANEVSRFVIVKWRYKIYCFKKSDGLMLAMFSRMAVSPLRFSSL